MEPLAKNEYRGGIAVWTIVAGIFAYAGISKYGVLLAYLNVSGYFCLLLAGFITYKINERLDTKIRSRSQDSYSMSQRLRFMKSVLSISIFVALIYLLFFIQPDKLVIAYFKGIPIEAFYPCSNRPLDPEIEKAAREIFRLRDIDRFDENFCS